MISPIGAERGHGSVKPSENQEKRDFWYTLSKDEQSELQVYIKNYGVEDGFRYFRENE